MKSIQTAVKYLAVILVLGGVMVAVMATNKSGFNQRNTDQAMASEPAGVPPIDAETPARIETATFAMG